MQGEDECALFVGGLRRDRKISLLKRKLIQLFTDCLGIPITYDDVNIIAPPGRRFAFVYLASVEDLNLALSKLSSPSARQELSFDFEEIQNRSRGLSVQIKLSRKELLVAKLSKHEESKQREIQVSSKSVPLEHCNNVNLDHSYRTPDPCRNSEGSEDTEEGLLLPPIAAQPQGIPVSLSLFKSVKTSTTGLVRRNKQPRKNLVSNSTSTTGLFSPGSSNHSLPDKYLLIGQYLGNETRSLEFKRGGGQYMKKQLKDHVAKYVCGFLNAGESGSLLIGVDDNGAVQGVECNQRLENDYRLLIDSVIKGIVPQVFPQQYVVNFVPVLEQDDEHFTPIADLYVVEIHVESVGKPERLYETHKGDVFMRRDGSVQGPLKASEIQEWTRMIHRQEERGRRSEVDRLQEEIALHRQREEELAQEHSKLMDQVKQLQNKKSRTCTLM